MLAVEDVYRDSRLLANYQLNLAAKDDEVSKSQAPALWNITISLSTSPHLLPTVQLAVVSTFQCDSGLGAYKLYELIYEEKDQKVV